MDDDIKQLIEVITSIKASNERLKEENKSIKKVVKSLIEDRDYRNMSSKEFKQRQILKEIIREDD